MCLLYVMMTVNVFAECVHEFQITGSELESKKFSNQNLMVERGDRFVPLEEMKSFDQKEIYTVQKVHLVPKDYDDTYLKYYHYSRIQEFIAENKVAFESKGYVIKVVGKSVQGRDLYVIHPQNIDPKKKVVLMYGRHHGDEGTANWIIEGFVEKVLASKWLEDFQLVLYPMINPDGAEAKRRYNANNRDLNRVWYKEPSRSMDEVNTIQTHMKSLLLDKGIRPVIALDMHGSFTRDFIYRVNKNFLNRGFFKLQGEFIDELGSRDMWQHGTFDLSDGDPQMARIYLVREFEINALTHETPRDIRHTDRRTLDTLKMQGVAVADSISDLY